MTHVHARVFLLATLAITGVIAAGRLPTRSALDENHPVDEPSSLWVVVNKCRPLPENYVPRNLVAPRPAQPNAVADAVTLRQDAARALEHLAAAAQRMALRLKSLDGFRSFHDQALVHERLIAAIGREKAERSSARPGHSEHQTGLAVDVAPASRRCELDACFAATDEGKWLANHAHDFGFIIRYLRGHERITGYEFEPWHLRYVGNELAEKLHLTGMPIETFFGLPPCPAYSTVSARPRPARPRTDALSTLAR